MKFYYQCVAFVITFLYTAVNHGQRSVISSSKLLQEKEPQLPVNKDVHARGDFFFMVGMALGSYYLGKISDQYDVRKILVIYSLVAGGLFSGMAFLMDEFFVKLLGSELYFDHCVMALMFLNGMTYSCCYPACAGLVLNWIDEHNRGRLATIWAGSLNFGGVAFFQMSYYTTSTLGLNWRWNYYITSIIFLILGIITYFILEPYPEKLGIEIIQSDDYQKQTESLIVEDESVSEWKKLKAFFSVKYVCIIITIYTVSITGGSILDFWLYSYLQNQGLYISAHKISELYEFFSFFGGLFIGIILDKQLKKWKVTTFCILYFITAGCFIFIQYNYKKMVYFIVVSIIGLTLGANYNYLVSVTAKLLLENPDARRAGLKISTIVGLLETFSSTFLMINFYYIPEYLDNLFHILGTQMFIAGLVCLPEVHEEFKRYKMRDHIDKTGDGENINLLN